MVQVSRGTSLSFLASVIAVLLSPPAVAQDKAATPAPEAEPSGQEVSKPAEAKGILAIPSYGGDLWNRPVLTGDWGGARTELADKGVQIGVDFTQVVQSIVSGGVTSATRYGGSLDYLLNLDLYRMGVLPGALVKIRAETRYGDSVNALAGPISPVNTDGFFPLSTGNIAVTITDLTYYQFLSERFAVFVGKIDTLDGDPNPFASGRGNTQFLDAAFVFPTIGSLCVPYSTLGVGVIVEPCPEIVIKSTLMNTTDASTTSGFGDFGDGWTWATEGDFQYRLGRLPGGQNLGFIYAADRNYLNFGGNFVFQPGQGLIPPTSNNTWAVYWSAWQYLHTEQDIEGPIDLGNGVPGVQGWGLFARAGFADRTTNPIHWEISAGVGGQGIIPGRDNDLFGVGYYYSSLVTERLTGAAGIHDYAQAFEAFYNIAITPAAQLTLDLQVAGGPWPYLDPAVVLGMRLFLNF